MKLIHANLKRQSLQGLFDMTRVYINLLIELEKMRKAGCKQLNGICIYKRLGRARKALYLTQLLIGKRGGLYMSF